MLDSVLSNMESDFGEEWIGLFDIVGKLEDPMSAANVTRLTMLAAIWGSSFLFMRVLAPVLGPVVTADARVLIAGIALVCWMKLRGRSLALRRFGRHYMIIGVVNSAVPFVLFCYAALHIPASYSAILNATAPLFGLALSAVYVGERPGWSGLIGGALGIVGVALITGAGPVELSGAVIASVLACLGAALCYAAAGVYMKRRASHIDPLAIAGASQLCAGIVLIPPSIALPLPGRVTLSIVVAVLALALVCSAVAYVLYYRLVSDCGPTKALTVTFLIPVFGILWGAIFLQESISLVMVFGCGGVVAGAALVNRGARRRPAREEQAEGVVTGRAATG